MPTLPNRYFIYENDMLTLRAAQAKRKNAMRYLTPERFILGPCTPAQVRALENHARTHPDFQVWCQNHADSSILTTLAKMHPEN